MKKELVKRLAIFGLIMGVCCGMYYFLSDGNPSVPDASQHREALYLYTFYILPLLLLGNCLYLFSYFITNVTVNVFISLIAGLLGPALLIYSVNTSKDSMAGMALLFMVNMYAIFSIIAFILLVIFQLLRKRIFSKGGLKK